MEKVFGYVLHWKDEGLNWISQGAEEPIKFISNPYVTCKGELFFIKKLPL
jgi:hypothetical protein